MELDNIDVNDIVFLDGVQEVRDSIPMGLEKTDATLREVADYAFTRAIQLVDALQDGGKNRKKFRRALKSYTENHPLPELGKDGNYHP